MKTKISVILLITLMACTSNNIPEMDTTLIGKWKLNEQLLDPGDGSGTFNPVNSNRVVEFFSNYTVTVNGEFCYMNSEVASSTSGTYTETSDNGYFDGVISPENCDYNETKVYYTHDGANLILWYQCIEGCAQKFVKI